MSTSSSTLRFMELYPGLTGKSDIVVSEYLPWTIHYARYKYLKVYHVNFKKL